MELKIDYLPVEALLPYGRNTRKHKDYDVGTIATSIKEYGFNDPIGVWGSKNVIVEGHGRLMAAKKLGMTEVPVVHLDHLTDEQRREYAIMHNKTAEMSEWDMSNLNLELEDLDLSAFGDLDFGEVKTSKVREDDYEPDPPSDPKAQRGDIIQLGRHRLMCGDSTILDDVQKLVDGATIDMLLTDPPYNIALGTGGAYKDNAKTGNHEIKENGAFLLNDDMPEDEFIQFLTDAFSNARMVMKPGAAFHIWSADSERYGFELAIRQAGLLRRQCLIWVKNSATLSRQDFQWQHEPSLVGEVPLPYPEFYEDEDHQECSYGWVDGGAHYWYRNRKQRTVLYFDRPTASKEHPTMKPILLFDYEIKCNTVAGEKVLDLFGGSGTTIMACEQDDRDAFVMEYDPKFADVIVDRWMEFTGQEAYLLRDGERIPWSSL